MIKTISFLLLFCFYSSLAWNSELADAKDKGLVGELPNGYISNVVEPPAPEIKKLIKEINNKRRKKYREISTKNKQPLDKIETMVGAKLRQKLKSGHFYKSKGKWLKKP